MSWSKMDSHLHDLGVHAYTQLAKMPKVALKEFFMNRHKIPISKSKILGNM